MDAFSSEETWPSRRRPRGVFAGNAVGEGLGLRVFEFFSGVGGLLLGLEKALSDSGGKRRFFVESVTAYDVNATANRTYACNFGLEPECISIEHLGLRDVDGRADLWLLSPPCQPYTRGGLQRDAADGRAAGLLNLLNLLQLCSAPPSVVFLENVKGFETSVSAALLRQCLRSRGYSVQEFLTSPWQLGIPTTRTRYYCLASRAGGALLHQPAESSFGETREDTLSSTDSHHPLADVRLQPPLCCLPPKTLLRRLRVADFLEELEPEALGKYLVPSARLEKFFSPSPAAALPPSPKCEQRLGTRGGAEEEGCLSGRSVCTGESPTAERNATPPRARGKGGFRLEVVSPDSTVCGTFTKGYGQNLHSGGPLLCVEKTKELRELKEDAEDSQVSSAAAKAACILHPETLSPERFALWQPRSRLRFFTERELLRLHGFPKAFSFPEDLSFRRRAALVGNSVSVDVVALLLRHLLHCMADARAFGKQNSQCLPSRRLSRETGEESQRPPSERVP